MSTQHRLVDGVAVEMAVAGAGPVVIVAHGIGFASSWRNYAWISEELPGYRIVSPSRPGYGATPLGAGRTIDEQADLYVRLLDEMECDRGIVMGFSMGAPSAFSAAARHPDRVAGLVLGCPVAAHMSATMSQDEFDQAISEERLQASFDEERALFRMAVHDEGFARAMLPQVLSPTECARFESDPRVGEIFRGYLTARLEAPPGFDGVRNDRIQRRRAAGGPAPARLAVPALVIYGSADDDVTEDHPQSYVAANPSARVEIIEGGSHAFHMTFAPDVFSRIGSFLNSL